MIENVIRQYSTEDKYRMQVYYNHETGKWVLSFTSMNPMISHEEEREYNTFDKCLASFNKNCKYYNVPEVRCTEETFLGLREGTLYPIPKQGVRNGK